MRPSCEAGAPYGSAFGLISKVAMYFTCVTNPLKKKSHQMSWALG